VLDFDRSVTSRRATRWLETNRSVRVVRWVEDLGEARTAILDGQVYAVLVFPRHLERDLGRRSAPHVTLLYNEQFLTVGNNLSADISRATSIAAGGLLAERGIQPSPIRVDLRILFNPPVNYGRAFVIVFIGGLLQVVVGISTIYLVGRELADKTATEWLTTARNSSLAAWVGKLAPYTIYQVLLLGGLITLYVVRFQVPVHGGPARLLVSALAFVLASQALGLLMIAGTASLRLGLTLGSLVFGPAAAFSGVTFPLEGMPVLPSGWAQAIPLTHLLQLARAVIAVEGPIGGPLAALGITTVVCLGLCIRRLPRLLREPGYWGRD
jgi:ABC-2 type transport system permease protein